MHKPIILMDVDGVMVDHQQEHLDLLNETYGTTYTKAYVTSFSYQNFPHEHAHFLRNLWHVVDYSEDTLSQSQIDTIEGLRSIGRVIACSSPLVGHADSKLAFLLKYFPRSDILLAFDKSLVKGEILIDDAPHQLAAFDGHSIIFHQPYNALLPGPRAHEFDDIGPLVVQYLMTCSDYDLS